MARKRKPLDLTQICDEDKAWFDHYCNVFAPKYGWPKLPIQAGYWSYFHMQQLVAEFHEEWPTWEELDAGMEATKTWCDGETMKVSHPFWLVQAKTMDDDVKYPNILTLRNWGLSGKSKPIDMRRCPKAE